MKAHVVNGRLVARLYVVHGRFIIDTLSMLPLIHLVGQRMAIAAPHGQAVPRHAGRWQVGRAAACGAGQRALPCTTRRHQLRRNLHASDLASCPRHHTSLVLRCANKVCIWHSTDPTRRLDDKLHLHAAAHAHRRAQFVFIGLGGAHTFGEEVSNNIAALRMLRIFRLTHIAKVLYTDSMSGLYRESWLAKKLSATVLYMMLLAYQVRRHHHHRHCRAHTHHGTGMQQVACMLLVTPLP